MVALEDRMAPLRVCIDARLSSGEVGGVEQVIIGLASGLSGLSDGEEQYFFLANPEATDWLKPYVSGPAQLLRAHSSPSATGLRQLKSAARRHFPMARAMWHSLPYLAPLEDRRLPRSDGTIEAQGVDLVHFVLQNAFRTRVPSIYYPSDLQHLHLPAFFTPRERRILRPGRHGSSGQFVGEARPNVSLRAALRKGERGAAGARNPVVSTVARWRCRGM
jgi:hypothetical protein